MTPIFDWSFAFSILPTLGEALIITIQATVLGMALAVTLGLALALLRRSKLFIVSAPAAVFIEFVRSTPLLVQIYFLFYVLPVTGVQMSPLVTGIVALGIHYAAYCAEVYRAGIEAVPRGQIEASTALNLSPFRTAVGVVLPQAIPPVVPALGNYLVAMFKDTPLLSAITVVELLQQSKMIGSATFRYTEPLTLVGIMFLLLSLAAAWGVRRLEHRLARYGGKR
ncbi:ectoine/hydroxyectoine ABC transporter permease subunit EhuD [Schauerella aestuarii]|jgi:polar amino acid transport system permease protein|uniref:ectoine/hydroxyectoine ABC transporter permease subunit EhuD n=1 Tax=Schauerella aestuarii TaxID=2511204 RepID=UPI0013697DE5|nr:ectoine/hydroxyectoine ABC transporter permease subunit EhuD [Achromobacter aestuarii]MYZ41816.1 ectoine/hydroxyectoine ABC transporter permease subunit EhuD [Achromobacter aestuarii]